MVRWAPARNHSALNSVMQALTPFLHHSTGEEKMFLVLVALEGTLSNGDCCVTAGVRGVKKYFIKYYGKSSDRNDFADKVVGKVLGKARFFKSMESIFYFTFKQVMSTKWWTASEAVLIFLGHKFLRMTEPTRKCIWDGRLAVRRPTADHAEDKIAESGPATATPFNDLYASYITQLQSETGPTPPAELPTMFDIVQTGTLLGNVSAAGVGRITRSYLHRAVVVPSPAFNDQPKSSVPLLGPRAGT